jgi:hypothetical protein
MHSPHIIIIKQMAKNHPLLIDIGEGLSLMLGIPTILTWNTSNRPQKPKRGTFGFNSETTSLEYWDGESWLKVEMK